MPPMSRPTSFTQMFPRRYLDPSDLPQGEMVECEILGIELSDYTIRQQQNPRRPGAQPVQLEWVMWFREFQKPMKFYRQHAKVIERLFGTDQPEEVIGQRISIYAGERESWGKMEPAILIHQIRPGPRGPLLAGAKREDVIDERRGTDRKACDMRKLGAKNAATLKAALAEQGATFDDALAWLKANDPVGFELAHGQALEDLPSGLAPALRTFLRAFGSAPKTPASDNGAIDFAAGLPKTAADAAPPARARKSEDSRNVEQTTVEEDDIPF